MDAKGRQLAFLNRNESENHAASRGAAGVEATIKRMSTIKEMDKSKIHLLGAMPTT